MQVSSDLLQQEILERLSIADILNACQSNQQFNKICQKESFWYRLVERDYPKHLIYKPSSWRSYYINLHLAPIVSFC